MTIEHLKQGESLDVKLIGILNYDAASDLKAFFDESLEDVNEVIIDMSEMDFLSTACLRVVLEVELAMQKRGGIVLKGVNGKVRDALKMACFDRFLKIVD